MADESGSSTTLLRVGMTCGGCEGSVKRILGRIEGIEAVTTDLSTKQVTVTHAGVDPELMITKLKKWADASGKEVAMWDTPESKEAAAGGHDDCC